MIFKILLALLNNDRDKIYLQVSHIGIFFEAFANGGN